MSKVKRGQASRNIPDKEGFYIITGETYQMAAELEKDPKTGDLVWFSTEGDKRELNNWGWNPIFYFIGRRDDGRFEQEQSQTAGVGLLA